MKILYFTDGYANNVMGTKISIAIELKKRGHEIIILNKNMINNIFKLIKEYNPDHIWLVHTGLFLLDDIKSEIKIPVIGIGMSDPYMQSKIKFNSYDVYITNHYKTFERYRNDYNLIYNKTACDFSFHKNLNLKKVINTSIIGVAIHCRWGKENNIRLEYVNKLRKEKFSIETYGMKWPNHKNNYKYIEGNGFLDVINKSKIGIDIQSDFAPLAHRMFEYSSCGTTCITRRREEVNLVFEEDEEILMYETYEELKDKLNYYLKNNKELQRISNNAESRCKKEHNITHRIDHIESEMMKFNIWE